MLLPGTAFADMDDLALTILFALNKFGVLFVVEANKSISVLAEQKGRNGTFLTMSGEAQTGQKCTSVRVLLCYSKD